MLHRPCSQREDDRPKLRLARGSPLAWPVLLAEAKH
jgi:hypothetical protein